MSLSSELINNISNKSYQIKSSLPDLVISDQSNKQLAWNDYKEGVQKWRIWILLANQDIQLRYRRSVLGPFWITLSMAITVYSMGYLYARLFKADLSYYYPFLVSGMLSWTLISSMVAELTDGLTAAESLAKQIKLPYTLYIHRIVYRNFLIFFHNLVVMVPILVIYHKAAPINYFTLLLIPSLLVIYINAISLGIIISMLGARYRDMGQMIKSLLQVIFFVTPIMWNPATLGVNNPLIILLNPVYAFIELIRQPLLGSVPTQSSITMVFAFTTISLLLSSILFIKYRSRIVYWL
jgi:lipopolysaccharide transport system permease protein